MSGTQQALFDPNRYTTNPAVWLEPWAGDDVWSIDQAWDQLTAPDSGWGDPYPVGESGTGSQ